MSDERRLHDRLPVTMTARIRCDGRECAGHILNVSEGGFLVQPLDALALNVGAGVEIETAQLGTVPAQVVGVSGQGLHLRVVRASDRHRQAIRRLALLVRPFMDAVGLRGWREA